MNDRHGQRNEWNDMCLVTNPVSACNITMVEFEFGNTVSGIGFHCRIPPVRIASTLNRKRYISKVLEPVVLPYIQRVSSAIF
ncbi:hypothetical protein TNCV_792481 [Trichonephila clavipes]|nr:hypothetical protein TNCV_792481 [Trichonephila clavipes]